MSTTSVKDFATSFGSHACAETVAPLAHKVGRLERAFHRIFSGCGPNHIKDSKSVYLEARSLGGVRHHVNSICPGFLQQMHSLATGKCYRVRDQVLEF